MTICNSVCYNTVITLELLKFCTTEKRWSVFEFVYFLFCSILIENWQINWCNILHTSNNNRKPLLLYLQLGLIQDKGLPNLLHPLLPCVVQWKYVFFDSLTMSSFHHIPCCFFFIWIPHYYFVWPPFIFQPHDVPSLTPFSIFDVINDAFYFTFIVFILVFFFFLY